MEPRVLADVRAERLIASGRLALSALTLSALWLDPDEPSRLPHLAYPLAGFYFAYSVLLAVIARESEQQLLRWRLPAHVLDLLVYTAIIFVTSGSGSPFFAYLLFALIAAAMRWQWTGVLVTAVGALGAYTTVAGPMSRQGADSSAVLPFVVRTGCIVVFAVFLGHLGAHQYRLRRDLDDLASWPATLSTDPSLLARQVLGRVASALRAREGALLWRDRQWSYFSFARSSPAGVDESTVASDRVAELVAPDLLRRSFTARDGRATEGQVLYLDGLGVHHWHGPILGSALAASLPAGPMISLPLAGPCVDGRIFAFRADRFSDDDLMLGEALTRLIVPRLDAAVASLRDQRAAAMDERVRLSRDLHDGVIQSLTGASLRLQTVDRLLETDPLQARQLLADIDELLISEQQELRWFLADPRGAGDDWAERLLPLFDRVSRNWGLQVQLDDGVDDESVLVGEFGHEVYRIIQEALVNAARHGHAKSASIEMSVESERLRLVVSDDGQGFPFSGELDHSELGSRRLGPVSIKQRVAGLGGRLAIKSGSQGARLHIELPLSVSSA